jgi:hypothetical protein
MLRPDLGLKMELASFGGKICNIWASNAIVDGEIFMRKGDE